MNCWYLLSLYRLASVGQEVQAVACFSGAIACSGAVEGTEAHSYVTVTARVADS